MIDDKENYKDCVVGQSNNIYLKPSKHLDDGFGGALCHTIGMQQWKKEISIPNCQRCLNLKKTKICLHCSGKFKDNGHKNKCCSLKCASRNRYKDKKPREPRYHIICGGCNNEFLSFYKRRKYCSNKCAGISRKGNLSSFKNGETICKRSGYISKFIRGNKNEKGKYIREHRYKIEQDIGRKLESNEIVHHIDFNTQNNDLSNLYLCASRSEHLTIHKELEYLAVKLVQKGIIKFKDGKYILLEKELMNNG